MTTEPTMNVHLTVSLDSDQVVNKFYANSLNAQSKYRIDAACLEAALKRGFLDVVVRVAPFTEEFESISEDPR